MQVTSQAGGVTADINYLRRPHFEYFLNNFFMHACTGWVSDDHIRLTMLCNEIIIQDFNNITCME